MSTKRVSKRARRQPLVDPSLTANFSLTAAEAFQDVPKTTRVPTVSLPTVLVDSVSVDKRRLNRATIPLLSSTPSTNPSTPVAGPSSLHPESQSDDQSLGFEGFFISEDLEPDREDDEQDDDEGCNEFQLREEDARKRGHTDGSPDDHMARFMPHRGAVLDELLWRDGRGDYNREDCLGCRSGRAEIRCTTCPPGPLLCEECAVHKHTDSPYHRLLHWTGRSFEVTSLKEIGLVIQLGHHHDCSPCSNPVPVQGDFCVIDINGQHNLALNFCGCDKAGDAGTHIEQLLRFDLYPATEREPNTTFTFQLLEHYHIQSLQGKISMFDYYKSLERMTDNTGTKKAQDRYKEFMRVVAQWRHLKLLKRSARGHDPAGVDATRTGELAVRCPACPHVDINLPPNWDQLSDDLKFLYVMSVAIDACFRLKRRAISNERKDPILGSGWAYFVEDTGYREVLVDYGDQDEISTCTGLSAIDHANTKYSKGYAATGVGGLICARHEFWLAGGMADLQAGKQYINMDYVFVCAMKEYLLVNKLVSYDIACQWSVNLLERISKFPAHLQIELPEGSIVYVIPKLHYGSHIREGHSPYSLNYRVSSARLDGEGIERRWWWMQPIAGSTKGMGPGTRQGYMEDNMGYSNWRKMVDMPWVMRDNYRKAVIAYTEQNEMFKSLTTSLDEENVNNWRTAVEAWEADPFNKPDPYVTITEGLTVTETIRQLSREEQTASAAPGFKVLHDISPVAFITMGLDMEDTQIRLKSDAKEATPSKLPGLLERRTAYRRKLQKYRELQRIYMPDAEVIFALDPACRTDIEQIEDARIVLPSNISSSHRQHVCPPRLQEMEARLHEAQCYDALQDLRHKLHTLSQIYKYKKINVQHQGPNTRVRTEIGSHNTSKDRAVQKYHRARRAKLALSGPGPWELQLRLLEDSDIRGLEDDDPNSAASKRKRKRGEKAGPMEGRQTISWIWRAADAGGMEDMVDSLRVEWLKARARVMRWKESVHLLPEEMRRVLVTHRFEEERWAALAEKRTDVDEKLHEGLVAYALKQSRIRCEMRCTFCAVCFPAVTGERNVEIGKEWDQVLGVDVSVDTSESPEVQHQDTETMHDLSGDIFT